MRISSQTIMRRDRCGNTPRIRVASTRAIPVEHVTRLSDQAQKHIRQRTLVIELPEERFAAVQAETCAQRKTFMTWTNYRGDQGPLDQSRLTLNLCVARVTPCIGFLGRAQANEPLPLQPYHARKQRLSLSRYGRPYHSYGRILHSLPFGHPSKLPLRNLLASPTMKAVTLRQQC